MTSAEDEQAIHQCQQGDISGLERLAQRYQVTALRLAFLLTGSADLAEDIVQDGFIHAYRHIHQFRQGSPFAPWFHRIVINIARQYVRSSQYHKEHSLQVLLARDDAVLEMVDSATQPEALVEHHETRRAIIAALAELTPKQREVIILRYYLGYQDRDIATQLAIPNNRVRQRIHTAHKALLGVIQQHYSWLALPDLGLPETLLPITEEK